MVATLKNNNLIEKIILGSVQFGQNYGINNTTGIPDDDALKSILDRAFLMGVKTIDCAESYGNALTRIANYYSGSPNRFNIISKLNSLEDKMKALDKVKATLEKLDIPIFDALLVHNVEIYLNNVALIDTLTFIKAQGLIKKIGVSIYTNEQFEIAIADKVIDIIQLPFNLLDNSSKRGELMKKAKVAGKTIHVRSVFLQGLLFKKSHQLPEFFTKLQPAFDQISNISMEFEIPVTILALSYVIQNSLIDGLIIGIDSEIQLNANLIACCENLPPECIERINLINVKDTFLLNPRKWILQ